jgi:ribosomal protein S18 acetylase RimI-like enzyme
MRCNPPELLSGEHETDDFSCGHESLDEWLKETALKSSETGDARTYVVVSNEPLDPGRVVGYYCISTGAFARSSAGGKLSRNAPKEIPTVVIGRLAVDTEFQDEGIGSTLIVDALERILQAASVVGARAVMVNPINERAREFYLASGFTQVNGDPTTLYMLTKDVRASFEATES